MKFEPLRIECRPRGAIKQLKRTEPKKQRIQVRRRINALRMKPLPTGTKKMAPLQGVSQSRSAFRARQGSYRIFYELQESQIVILRIMHRRQAYR